MSLSTKRNVGWLKKSSSLAGLRKGIVVLILPLSAASFLIENRRIKMR